MRKSGKGEDKIVSLFPHILLEAYFAYLENLKCNKATFSKFTIKKFSLITTSMPLFLLHLEYTKFHLAFVMLLSPL